MMFCDLNPEMLEKRSIIKKKIEKGQKDVFALLLEISRSFPNEDISSQCRNDMFEKVDALRKEIKENSKKVKLLELGEDVEMELLPYTEDVVVESEVIDAIDKLTSSLKEYEEQLEENLQELDEIPLQEDSVSQAEVSDNSMIQNENPGIRVRKSRSANTQLAIYEEKTNAIQGLFGKLKNLFRKNK